MHVIYAIFFILMCSDYFNNFNVEANIKCTSNADCEYDSKVRSLRCSICADTDSGKSECLFPFNYMYESNLLRCVKLNTCPITCHPKRAQCIQSELFPAYYTPTCKCFHPYYGDNCQYEATNSQKIITSVSWVFKGFISVSHKQKLYFLFFSPFGSDFSTTKMTLRTDYGYFESRSSHRDVVKAHCHDGTYMCNALHINVEFPYIMFSPTGRTEFLTLKDRVLGYYARFTIEVVDLGKTIFYREYQIIVDYKKTQLKCIATIELINCSPYIYSPAIFTRLTDIDIQSEIHYVTDGGFVSTPVDDKKCSDDNTFEWNIRRFTVYNDTLESTILLESYKNQFWHFDPYTLDLGFYRIFLKVKHVNSLISNTAYCYIKVKTVPLIFIVEGGHDRLIDKNEGLTLSAVQSTDPNMPPLKQGDLFVEWSCKRISPRSYNDPICALKKMRVDEPYFIPSEKLMYSAVYRFKGKLWSSLYNNCVHCFIIPQTSFIRIQVRSEQSFGTMSVQCVENCEGKVIPNQPLLLKVISENIDIEKEFKWTYSNASVVSESLDAFKVLGMPSFMLLLKEDSLEKGAEYTITARHYLGEAYAKYSFQTDTFSYDEVCIVEPMNGTRGLTEFNIICPLKENYALFYEFYDKSNGDTNNSILFNGRMLGTTHTGEIRNVRLTRGDVTILIINSWGLSVEQIIIVPLSDWNVTAEVITELKKDLTDSLINSGDELQVVKLSSLITEVLPSKEENDFKFLLGSLSQTSIKTFAEVKCISSSLYILLRAFKNPSQVELQDNLVVSSLDFIKKLTNVLRESVFERNLSQYNPSKVIREVAEILLRCFSEVIKCRVIKLVDIEQDKLGLTEITQKAYGAYIMGQTIDNLKDVLTFIQYPGKPPLNIYTENKDIMIWTVTNDQNYKFYNYLNKNYDIPVRIPIELITLLTKKTYKQLSLQIAYVGDSHFKWYKSDVKSNMVSVSIATRKGERDLNYIHSLERPLFVNTTLAGNLENLKKEATIKQVDPSLDQDYLDTQVKIYRLDIRPRSNMTLVFLYPPTNGSLRVSVMEEYRPDYKYMTEHSVIISKEIVEYPYPNYEYDEPRFVYVGIIPGKEVPVNQSVNYAFEVNNTICQYWSRNSWKSDGCLVSHYSKGKKVICQCTHLSVFGAAFLVPPLRVDPFREAKLFLTILDNPLVVALVTTILIVYIFLCVYLWNIDKKDSLWKNIIVLEDDFPFDNYSYLLAVFTSPRFNAGTTANVGLKLFGNKAQSRAHILTSYERKVLRTGSDDWFLIHCPKHLGKLEHLHVWHDNSGRNPSWFCEKILVYDLTYDTETEFVVEEWLALCFMTTEKEMCYPEARILPTDVDDISSVKRTFVDNVVLGIRDAHRLMCLFYRLPRSTVTRVQRLSINILFVLVTMLNVIMYYKPVSEETEGVDEYQFGIETKELVISIQGLVLSTVLTYLVLYAFRKSFKVNTSNIFKRSTLYGRFSQTKKTQYSKYKRFITTIMKNPPLQPVQLPNTPREGRIKSWYIFAWISCITIMLVCAYFVMLYGLKLGPVKSKKWLSSVLLAVGQDNLITGPLRIVLFAIGLSLTFQLITDVHTYKISMKEINISQRESLRNSDVGKIFMKRRHQKYIPLPIKTRHEILHEKEMWSLRWTVLNFVAATVLLFVTFYVINILWTSHHYYYTNNHILNMITDTKYPLIHSTGFYNVSNITTFEHYLSNNLINIIYNSRWYNEKLINDSSFTHYNHWTSDFTNKLIGRPKMRQLRTKAVSCHNCVMINGLCIQKWSKRYEDTNVYSKSWNPANHNNLNKEDSYWIYREKTSLFKTILGRFFGPSGRQYHDGGYSVTLGPTRIAATYTLDELEEDGWQDELTRVLFVELTTFNSNNILFSQASLIVEYLVSGTVLLKAQVYSVSGIFDFNLWSYLFVVFIIFCTLKTVYLVSYYGLLKYLTNGFHNIIEIVIVIFGILSITLFCIHYHTASQYINYLQHLEYDRYFEFDYFIQYFILLKISLSILLSMSTIRVFGFINVKQFMTCCHTFTSSLKCIYWLTLFILLVYIMLTVWTHLFGIAFLSLKELLTNIKSLNFMTTQNIQNTYVKIFIIFKMFLIYALNAIFLMILVLNTRYSRSNTTTNPRFSFRTLLK